MCDISLTGPDSRPVSDDVIATNRAYLREYVRLKLELQYEKPGPIIPESTIPERLESLLDQAIELTKQLQLPSMVVYTSTPEASYEFVTSNMDTVLWYHVTCLARQKIPSVPGWLALFEDGPQCPPYEEWTAHASRIQEDARALTLSVCKSNVSRVEGRVRVFLTEIQGIHETIRRDILMDRSRVVERRRAAVALAQERSSRLAYVSHQLRYPRVTLLPAPHRWLQLVRDFDNNLLHQLEPPQGERVKSARNLADFGDIIVEVVNREKALSCRIR